MEKSTGGWIFHDNRDTVVDFNRQWSTKAEVPLNRVIAWLGVTQSKFNAWIERYGKSNEHNGLCSP